MVSCEVCNEDIDLDDEDVTYAHEVVRLGDGSIDDEFYVCSTCVEENREQQQKWEDEQYEKEQAKYRHPSGL